MRTYQFSLTAVLVLAVAFPAFSAEKPRTAQGNANQPKKVWTNEDLDVLRSRGLISTFSPEMSPTATPATTSAVVTPTSSPVYTYRTDDPKWYAEKAAQLQAELDEREAALQQQQTAMAQVHDRITQPGVAMDKPTYGVTPEAALAVLAAQVSEVQIQLDELSDLARQNNIPPGVLGS